MDFNLQDFLRDMRIEQREDIKSLTGKVDKIAIDLASHDRRITAVESVYKAATWLTRIGVGAIVTLLIDILKNHLPKLLAK